MGAEALDGIRAALEADGYRIEVKEGTSGRVGVVISATPEACADCLVPPPVMRSILGEALGVPGDSIDLTYPATDSQTEGGEP